MKYLDVDAINRVDNLLLTTDGDVLPITNYLDDEGDECTADEAVAFVGGAGSLWFGGMISDFESGRVH